MGQLACWLTFIEQFTFEVVHRAGPRHGNAHALSRKPDAHPEASVAAQEMTKVKTVAVRAADA